jgi:hypothetical protein
MLRRIARPLPLVRSASLAIVGGAWCLALFATPRPKDLPGAALGSEVLWRAEIALALVVALLFVLVVLVRGWRGDLPNAFSERGATWPEIVATGEHFDTEISTRIDKLQAQIDSLSSEVDTWKEQREREGTQRKTR